MDTRVIIVQFLWLVLIVAARNIHHERHFCGGKQLHEVFTQYNCTYHESETTYAPHEKHIGITECCHSPCTEYYVISTYCKCSNMSYYAKEEPPIANEIFRESLVIRPKSNVILRDSINHEVRQNPVTDKVSNRSTKLSRRNRKRINKRYRSQMVSTTNSTASNSRNRGARKRGECQCTCRKRRAKVNLAQYKPAVVGLGKFNAPIPIRRSSYNHQAAYIANNRYYLH